MFSSPNQKLSLLALGWCIFRPINTAYEGTYFEYNLPKELSFKENLYHER